MNLKLICITGIILLSGCASTIKAQKFPDSDTLLTTPCPALDLVPADTTKLSDLEKVVGGNYTKYHQCANEVNGWILWYNEQKKNYESVGTK
jgi:hypothetical protein